MNILSVLYLLVFAFSGIMISDLAFSRDKPVRRIFYGLVFGLAMLLWLPVLFAFMIDFTLTAQMLALITAGAAGIVCGIVREVRRKKGVLKVNRSKPENLKAMLWTAVPLLVIGWVLLINHTIVPASNGSLHVGQCTYGDLCMHLGFISSISVQQSFPPNYSILPGTQLGYPFLCDSVSSTFYTLGASLRFAALLPALYAYALVVFGVFLFFESWFKRGSIASFATYLFFIGGGLGFAYIFNNQKLLAADGIDRWRDMIEGFYQTPTNIPDQGLRWVNTIADMLVPQRATLFGWALLFPCLQLLYRAVMERENRLFIPLGILAGCLPLVHTHSFLALGMIAFFLLVGFVGKYLRGAVRTGSARLAVPVLGMALAVLLLGFIGGRTKLIMSDSNTAVLPKVLSLLMALIFGIIIIVCSVRERRRGGNAAKGLGFFTALCFCGVVISALLIFYAPQDAAGASYSSRANLIGLAIAAATAIAMAIAILNGGLDFGRDRAAWKHIGMFLLFGVIAVALAAPQLLGFTFKQSVGDQFTRWNFNWANVSDGWLWFYIKNLGLIFIFMFPAFFAASRRTKAFYGGSLLIWLVCEFILFQPNSYDNNKLLFIWFAFTCGIVAEYLIGLFNKLTEAECVRHGGGTRTVSAGVGHAMTDIKANTAVRQDGMQPIPAAAGAQHGAKPIPAAAGAQHGAKPIPAAAGAQHDAKPIPSAAEAVGANHGSPVPWGNRLAPRIIALFVLVALFLSGTLTLVREYVSADHVDGSFKYVESGYEVVSASLVELTEFIKANTEPDATFLTHNNHNNAIAMLTGRNIFCGSGTFLYYHGVNFQPRQAMLKSLYETPGQTLIDAASNYDIDYVLIGPFERSNYNVDSNWFDNNLECIYSQSGVKLYRVNAQ